MGFDIIFCYGIITAFDMNNLLQDYYDFGYDHFVTGLFTGFDIIFCYGIIMAFDMNNLL